MRRAIDPCFLGFFLELRRERRTERVQERARHAFFLFTFSMKAEKEKQIFIATRGCSRRNCHLGGRVCSPERPLLSQSRREAKSLDTGSAAWGRRKAEERWLFNKFE